MRIAIFGDVHGNRHALAAVLDHVAADRPDSLYCLGDLVGYGAFPNEVTECVAERRIPTVMGNYDEGVGFDRDECGCAYKTDTDRELGQRSLEWTKAATSAANKARLRACAREIRVEVEGQRILLVHGSPRRINEYLFEDRPLSSFERLAAGSDADVVVFGHTHVPYIKRVGGVLFVNAGSVGKPKDGDPRACYVILDVTAQGTDATFHRVPYDVAAAAAAIRATTLPHKFATDVETAGSTMPAPPDDARHLA